MPKKMRLPNGFGNINKLSGNRRNPYRARVHRGYTDDGKREYETVGYFEKYNDAFNALVEYHRDPCEFKNNITFEEVYDAWSREKFDDISDSNIKSYKASYNLCTYLYKMPMKDIRLAHLQSVVDKSQKNYPTLRKLKSLLSQIYSYAIKHDIINQDKDKTEFIDIGKRTQSSKHYKFNQKEIEKMWKWSKNDYVQVILMLIYSGARPGELFNVKKCDVNLDEEYFTVVRGKNENAERRVPIHKKVLPFYHNWMSKDGEYLITQLNGKGIDFQNNHGQYVETYWAPVLTEMGILKYINDKGEEQEHKPHDTRHTFTSMWKTKRLDETFRRKIQGHSGKGIGEIVYTHLDFEELKSEINKL